MTRRERREPSWLVLKGARTYITTPDHQTYSYGEGRIGLATSGSGDTLGGAIAGLLARGATAPRTAVWGVYLHGQAGATLTDRLGKPGLLERR